jgi:excisionase family DNA binding protein
MKKTMKERMQELQAAARVARERPIVGASEAAALLGVSAQSVRRWTDAGFLRAMHRTTGKHRRYARTEIVRFRDATGGVMARRELPKCPHCGKSLYRASSRQAKKRR